jgi:hypothetical protein
VLEIWLTIGFLALLTSLLSSGGKRLGDIFAGTFVITERLPGPRGTTAPMSALPPALAAWAATAELSGLTDATAETARQYLSRYFDFTPATREEFGRRIAAAVTAQVTPPPPADASPPDYLSAVLAERRDRAHARMTAQARPGSPAGGTPAPPADGTARPPAGTSPASPAGDSLAAPAAAVPPVAGPDAPTPRPGGFLPPR